MKFGLIVDDSKVVRTFIKKILQELNFETNEAVDGLDALTKCKERLPDFIMLDWNMPNMNGLEFIKELRKSDHGHKPVVIFCTTENDVDKITSAINQGANEYIMKPFDSDILKSKLSQVGIL